MKRNYIIIVIIIILIIGVFVFKQTKPSDEHLIHDENCNHNTYSYKLYNFSSEFCPVCENVKPIYNEMKEIYKDKIEFIYVDIEKNSKLSQKYDIMYTPTFIIEDNKGNILDKKIGYLNKDKFKEFIDRVIK